jgi:hypothetical protein
MALRIRYQYPTGATLGYSIERLSDGTFFNFGNSTFTQSPVTLISALPEDTGSFSGRYKVTLTSTTASQFTDGDYVVTIHNITSANAVTGELGVVMHGGDDATVIPGSAGGSDPWATALPGAYTAGTAGAIIGGNLDAKMSTRSTFGGGPVTSVTAPVTVGANNDKSGYTLAPSGLDAIQVEAGVNVRQALSPILAASAGVLLGAGTGTIVIKGGNVALTRITASTDNAGNRTAVTLSLPT